LLNFKRNLENQGFSYFFVLNGLIPVDTKIFEKWFFMKFDKICQKY